MKIIVSTWFDTITSESAEHGSYESTGNNYIDNEFTDLNDAVEFALKGLNCLENDSDLEEFLANPTGTVVLNSANPVQDYHTGDEDMYSASITIVPTKVLIKNLNQFGTIAIQGVHQVLQDEWDIENARYNANRDGYDLIIFYVKYYAGWMNDFDFRRLVSSARELAV